MGAERRIFIWQTVAVVALAIAVMVAPSLFPNMPPWLLKLMFGGGVLATITAFATLYFLQGKKNDPKRDVNTPVSVPRESSESKKIPIWYIIILVVMWPVIGVYETSVFNAEPEYTKGLSIQEIMDMKEALSHLKPRTVTIECANTECSIPLINGFHYMLLGWPHSMDDPEAGIMLPFKHAEGVKGLQLSPNDETTRAIKKAIEEKTKLTVNLLGRPEHGNTSRTILLLVGSPP